MSIMDFVSSSVSRLRSGGLGERAKGTIFPGVLGALQGGAKGFLSGGFPAAGLGALTGAPGPAGGAFLFSPARVGAEAATREGRAWVTGRLKHDLSDHEALQGFHAEAKRLSDRRLGPDILDRIPDGNFGSPKWLAVRLPSWMGHATGEQGEKARVAAEVFRNEFDRIPAPDRIAWLAAVRSELDSNIPDESTNSALSMGAATGANVLKGYVASSLQQLRGGGLGSRVRGAAVAAGLGALKGGALGSLAGLSGAVVGGISGGLAAGVKSFLLKPFVGEMAAEHEGRVWAAGRIDCNLSEAESLQGFYAEAKRLSDRRLGPEFLDSIPGALSGTSKWLATRMPGWMGIATRELGEKGKSAAEDLRNEFDRIPAVERRAWLAAVLSELDINDQSGQHYPGQATSVSLNIDASSRPVKQSSKNLSDIIDYLHSAINDIDEDSAFIESIKSRMADVRDDFLFILEGSCFAEESGLMISGGLNALESAIECLGRARDLCMDYTQHLIST